MMLCVVLYKVLRCERMCVVVVVVCVCLRGEARRRPWHRDGIRGVPIVIERAHRSTRVMLMLMMVRLARDEFRRRAQRAVRGAMELFRRECARWFSPPPPRRRRRRRRRR